MDDDEMIKEFLVESYENLDSLDREFVELESDPARERLAAIFRTIHTIKGTSGFLGLTKLQALTHAGESLLSLLRDGALVLTPEITSALLAMVDGVRAILSCLESSRSEGTRDYAELIALLERLQHQRAEREEQEEEEALPAATAMSAKAESKSALSDSSIRVDVGLLDKLMNLVGELVLARNQILQIGAHGKDAGFFGKAQRLNLITTELQEGVMKTRMQPIGNLWNKLPRVVRDLAVACGKQVTVEMEGKETDLDRTIIEAIKDPLTHIVRNAVDHGIETPEARRAKGKSPIGALSLRAFHEGGQVNIEVSDDGAGIDVERVREKAVERGLVTADRARQLGEREVMNLIFLPGFSTAEKITNVSGRGVGMDVVRTNIEKIGGTVDVHSRPGLGSTLKIKIPLTLAIIPALVVSSGAQRFAIPQVNLLELVRLEAGATSQVEEIHGAPVYRLRGKLLPLVYLARTLGLPEAGAGDGAINIVVVRADDREFGLVVDAVSDTEEIVVKPLGKELKWLNVFAGATIMGDGEVALILDVLGIARRANVVSEVRDRALVEGKASHHSASEESKTLLLFRAGDGARMALPLDVVARLEELSRERVERAGARDVIQYRGEILPLVDLGEVFGGDRSPSEALQVVVTSVGDQRVGLVVDQILDIARERAAIKRGASRPGVLGAAVIQGKVTELVDVAGAIAAVAPGLFEVAS